MFHILTKKLNKSTFCVLTDHFNRLFHSNFLKRALKKYEYLMSKKSKYNKYININFLTTNLILIYLKHILMHLINRLFSQIFL